MSFTACWIAFSLFLMGGICASCSDDDVNGSGSGDDEEELEVDQNYSDSISAQIIIENLYDLEGVSYQFNRGERINAAEPNRYYMACSSTKEAALFYNAFCTNDSKPVTFQMEGDSLVSYIDIENRRTEFGDYGYTSLALGDGSSEYATIEVSLSDIGETHQLVFVPETFLPQNSSSSDFKSPCSLGDVYLDEKGYYWLCVKESSFNESGYLVSIAPIESGYWELKTKTDLFKWTVYHAEGVYNQTAWTIFLESLQNTNVRNGVQIIVSKGGSHNLLMGTILDVVLGNNSSNLVFQCGEVRWNPGAVILTSDAPAAQYYRLFIPYIFISPGTYNIVTVESDLKFNNYNGMVNEKSLNGPQLVCHTFGSWIGHGSTSWTKVSDSDDENTTSN